LSGVNSNKIYSPYFYLIASEDMSFGYNKNQSEGLLSATIPKRENAWNTIEPGDPYDIRKYP
jgi:hypothetical protein